MRRLVLLGCLPALLLGLSVGCGGTQESAPSGAPSVPAASPTAPPPEPATVTDAEPSVTLEVWFLRGEKLFLATRDVEKAPRVAAAALEALLAGPSEAEAAAGVSTAIPEGARLLGVTVEDGIAAVDLGAEYESGGGSLSMTARLAQVVYTLTQFPTVQGVRFELEGRPVEVFSGEGIVLDAPVERKDYDDLFPAIVVASPGIGARAGNPVHIAGQANVFEANVNVRILDAQGREIVRSFVTASCGTGCLGDFSADVPYEVAEEQAGMIQLHSDDAAGTGTLPNLVEIPVVLTP